MTKKVRKEVQIVLTETIQNLGKAGSLVVVRSGFARNYLIPKEKGELATSETIKTLEIKQKDLEAKEKQYIDLCLKNKSILEETGQFIIQKRIGDDNKIFGKITLKQVREIIEARTNVDLSNCILEIPEIKEIGIFNVSIILHATVKASINFEILPQ
jgi:large subunit ribosomal protein L9